MRREHEDRTQGFEDVTGLKDQGTAAATRSWKT